MVNIQSYLVWMSVLKWLIKFEMKNILMKSYRFLQLILVLIFTQCFPTPKVAGQFTDREFDEMANRMATGTVQDISVEEVSQQLDKVILLDTRERKEYEVSHLPNAIWVGYDDFDIKRLGDVPKNAKVVTYCSVGYRSERIGEKLQKAGYTDVSNLKGSIFKWVNEGLSVVDINNQPTEKVHGYNEKWGKWVKKGKVVY